MFAIGLVSYIGLGCRFEFFRMLDFLFRVVYFFWIFLYLSSRSVGEGGRGFRIVCYF